MEITNLKKKKFVKIEETAYNNILLEINILKEQVNKLNNDVAMLLSLQHQSKEENNSITSVQNMSNGEKSAIIFPYIGIKWNSCCDAIKENYGIYSQCLNEGKNKIIHEKYGELYLCNSCIKSAINNEPKFGFIQERLEKGNMYITKKQKRPLNYSTVMISKLNIEKQVIIEELNKKGIKISFDEEKDIIELTDKWHSNNKLKLGISKDLLIKKRGRPRKVNAITNTVVNRNDIPDIPDTLETTHNPTINIDEWICPLNGVKFLRDFNTNKLYDIQDGSKIGMWDNIYSKIIEEE